MSLARQVSATLMVAAITVSFGPAWAETAIPAERNPPGDIPDSQVFVDYAGPGFTIKVPDGWARTDEARGAKFADKYNTIEVTAAPATAAPMIAGVTGGDAKALAANGH